MTVNAGWHGRRRAGAGLANFCKFRLLLVAGEPVKRIDWRPRATTIFMREREREAAHTGVAVGGSFSSMAFRSHLSQTTKRDRALVLLLALADLRRNR
ncbi:MAG: hypothetical protein HPM95_14665 [Alphaproteobacteria bacterium]|nr:hypothetical protein [Alphaproteobacteria bacterium]